MTTLAVRLRESGDAIVQRWFEAALATYPADSVPVLRRQRDRFANPIGHSLRVATREIFEALLDGMDAQEIRRKLSEVIRIRAVQELSPSQALGFVFHLKEAVRAELGKAATDSQFASEMAVFEGRIDRVALAAFDVFVRCREQVYELRVNEAKRRVSWIVDKINNRGLDPELSGIDRE